MDRRTFLTVGLTAAGALWVGCGGRRHEEISSVVSLGTDRARVGPPVAAPGADLSAWIRIGADDGVSLFVPEAEMGQGIHTAVAMILADELHLPLADISVFHAPLDPEAFGRQSTGGSTSIRGGIEAIRSIGAAARTVLIEAAAEGWGVDPGACRVADGEVVGPDGQRTTYGPIAAAAAARPAPSAISSAPPPRHVGQDRPRLDLPPKVDGTAVYGMDVQVEGMRVAAVAHCPIFGGSVAQVDDVAARAVPGVVDVVRIPTGVAVVAEHTWAALQGRRALAVSWDDGGFGSLSSASISEACAAAVPGGVVAAEVGDAPRLVADAAPEAVIEAIYEVPFLAHTPMEPLNCTAHVTDDGCEVWVSTQSPTATAAVAAEIAGVATDRVVVHSTLLGGGFGRRSQTDFVAEAVHVSRAIGGPVKLVWSRSDDVQGGWYRPMAYNRMTAAVGDTGEVVAWIHQIASPSILRPQWGLPDGLDGPAVEGAANLPYAIGAKRVTWADLDLPIPVCGGGDRWAVPRTHS